MGDLDKNLKRLEAEMRKEAVRRLKTIKPNDPALAEQFQKNGTVYVEDTFHRTKNGEKIRKANKAEMEVVRFMEDEQGNLPYFIYKTETVRFDTVYFFLYVSYDKRSWSLEAPMKEACGTKYMEPRIFEVNAGIRAEDDEGPISIFNSRFTTMHIDF